MSSRTGKYKQFTYEVKRKYQPLIWQYSEHIETGWEHKEVISKDRGVDLEIHIRKK